MFIAIEGPEGSGKSTLSDGLTALYQKRGFEVVQSREPGGTPVGEEFRRVLKDPRYQGKFPPLAELFGFLAARAAFLEGVVVPALAEGKIVITDRYSLSTMAYQIAGRGLPEERCMPAIQLAEGDYSPFYVVLLVSPEVGLKRKKDQNDDKDRFAQENVEYHHRIKEGYRRYASFVRGFTLDADYMDQADVLRVVSQRLEHTFWETLHVGA
jgi:dTMP kinase